MTTDKEVMQMALDALEQMLPLIEDFGAKEQLQIQHKAIAALYEALRAALANEFNPDWDAMAVMVEEQQRMAAEIETLKRCLFQMQEAAKALAAKEPIEYTGNGTAGRESDVRPTGFFFQADKKQEPVAWIEEAKAIAAQCWCDSKTSHIVMEPALAESIARRIAAWMETGAFHARNEAYWRDRALKAEEAAPPQREWQGLTDGEIAEGCRESWVTESAWESAVWWAMEKLKEKNNG